MAKMHLTSNVYCSTIKTSKRTVLSISDVSQCAVGSVWCPLAVRPVRDARKILDGECRESSKIRILSLAINMALPTLYTACEVAGKLRVSRRSVYQWLSSGHLDGFKAGQSWRITEDDLIMFMKRRSLPAGGQESDGGIRGHPGR